MYSHGQELFYKFFSKITNRLVKQLLSMTVHLKVLQVASANICYSCAYNLFSFSTYRGGRIFARFGISKLCKVVTAPVLFLCMMFYQFMQICFFICNLQHTMVRNILWDIYLVIYTNIDVFSTYSTTYIGSLLLEYPVFTKTNLLQYLL